MTTPHDENDVLCECQRCYPHDEDDDQCTCELCFADEVAAAEEEQEEEEEDDEDETHPDDCTCGPCCHAQMVGLVSVAGDGDPLEWLDRHGVQGLVEIGKDVLAGGPVDAPEEPRLAEDDLQAMQACAFGGALSNERRNLLHRVNFQHPDLVTSSDLFRFEPVLTAKGRALLVTLGRLPAKLGEVAP